MAKRQKYPVAVAERDDIHIKHLIKAKTPNQAEYLDSLRSKRLVFGIGPAGTGKSFLATAVGLEKLLNNEVAKIIICRPAVEAGEKLGFLPGTMEEKITPFLRPIIDAIEDHVGIAKAKLLMASGKIEFATLAHMRGRTLNDAYVIGDELQNATWEQIRMLVTRMGFGSFFCLNGDPTQSDLPKRDQGGLHRFTQRLSGVSNDIDVVHFEKGDIVRDPLIALILDHVDVDLEQDDRKEPIIARKPATPYEAPPVITRHNGHDRIQKPALLVSVSNPPETN